MATLYVRDLSDEAVEELKGRAARRRQSLQAYARELLELEASAVTQDEVLDRIRSHASSTVTAEEIVAEVQAGRNSR
jgi:plasmid stability protein